MEASHSLHSLLHGNDGDFGLPADPDHLLLLQDQQQTLDARAAVDSTEPASQTDLEWSLYSDGQRRQ